MSDDVLDRLTTTLDSGTVTDIALYRLLVEVTVELERLRSLVHLQRQALDDDTRPDHRK